MSGITHRAHARLVEMALRYSQADRTDPFAFNRAMTHIQNGIATLARQTDGEPAYYEADAYQEDAIDFLGRPHKVTRYKNMKRP